MRVKKHKKVCTILNYLEYLLILDSAVTGCLSISTFASLFDIHIPIRIMSSAVGIEICAITAGTQKYKSSIKKKKHDKIILLPKSKMA